MAEPAAARRRLDAAIGDPGLMEVFDADSLERLQRLSTENGAHTLGVDSDRRQVVAFLPQTHRARVQPDAA